MVLFLDLEVGQEQEQDTEDASDEAQDRLRRLCIKPWVPLIPLGTEQSTNEQAGRRSQSEVQERRREVLVEALSCYPISVQLVSSIDLNTLDALSCTSRRIRSSLLQNRSQLIHQTLRCSNDEGQHGQVRSSIPCARDLVSECRRCGTVICRNCTIKPPRSGRLAGRLRRLCAADIRFELSNGNLQDNSRTMCTCASHGVHLCVTCGSKLDEEDTIYQRVWTWRTRYTTYLGGLGTGIGEGNEGVPCARGSQCRGSKEVEVEFECSGALASALSSLDVGTMTANTPNLADQSTSSSNMSSTSLESDFMPADAANTFPLIPSRHSSHMTSAGSIAKDEAGYLRQEIEGLGGVVKTKFRKRERLGAPVKEWEDERDGGEILGREKHGLERAWCGWCARFVLANDEMQALTERIHIA